MHLKKCSGCARAIVESATTCDYCGQQVAVPIESVPRVEDMQDEALPQLEDLYDEGLPPLNEGLPPLDVALDTSTPQPPLSVPEVHDPPVVAKRYGKRELMTGLVGVVGGGLLILMVTSTRGAASRDESVAQPPAARPAAEKPAARNAATKKASAAVAHAPNPPAGAVAAPSGTASQWTSNPAWVGGARRAAAFEVPSTSRVQVWMRRVQPMLVVRCRANILEAFVFTDSAAKMEPQDQDHTVRVQFDGQAAVSERWPDSSEHDALFARDPQAFVRQLLGASTLQFSFSPHNADSVVAVFNVAGLQEHLATAAKSCGLKTAR
jgi:hypothetical protein